MSEPSIRFRTDYRSAVVSVGDWRCHPRASGEGAAEESADHQIVFTRSGAFRKSGQGGRAVADPATAVFFARGEEYRVGHPVPGGDHCVVLTVAEETLHGIAGGSGGFPFPAAWAPVGPAAALGLRRLLASLAGDPLEIDERAIVLAGGVLRAGASMAGRRDPRAVRAGTMAHHDRVVERARLFAAEHFRDRLTIAALGRAAGASPFHLCRLFRRATGLPVHRHVNRLRLLAGLDLLEPGADLARIALDVGFSSHSHFATAFRREFGRTPSEARAGITAPALRKMRTILKAPAGPPA